MKRGRFSSFPKYFNHRKPFFIFFYTCYKRYKKLKKGFLWLKSKGHHCEFLEYWNTKKSVWRIWQTFSCLLDEGIPKIWKKLNSHDGFLSYLQNSTANSAHLAAYFCTALVYPQKATVRIQFLPYFWNPFIK